MMLLLFGRRKMNARPDEASRATTELICSKRENLQVTQLLHAPDNALECEREHSPMGAVSRMMDGFRSPVETEASLRRLFKEAMLSGRALGEKEDCVFLPTPHRSFFVLVLSADRSSGYPLG